MGDEVSMTNEYYEFDYLNVTSGTQAIPTATVRIKTKNASFEESATGDGPVDALLNAVDRALNMSPVVESYHVRSVTSGRQALGEVNMRIRLDGKPYHGRGISTDIVEATGRAYLQAFNHMEAQKKEEKIIIESNALSNAG